MSFRGQAASGKCHLRPGNRKVPHSGKPSLKCYHAYGNLSHCPAVYVDASSAIQDRADYLWLPSTRGNPEIAGGVAKAINAFDPKRVTSPSNSPVRYSSSATIVAREISIGL